MHIIQGGCHCGNISYIAEMPHEASTYRPRACDCSLCTIHGASYASDKNGTLTIKVRNKEELNKYRQGSRIADFLICKKCGVMTGVCYEEKGCIYGSINIRSAHEYRDFSESQVAHLTRLTDDERIDRWKGAWFSNVKVEYEGI